jgi:hypothetical protein
VSDTRLLRARLTALALALAIGLGAGTARAERRIAVVAGSDLGGPEDPPLRFAQRDALSVARVLTELAGVSRRDLLLALGDASALRAALAQAEALAATGPTTVFFYYSGHADQEALHIGPARVPWAEVRAFLDGGRSGLRIAVLDACQAGGLTTAKGFTVVPAALPVPQTGSVVLAAAAPAETAQEAQALGGSFFTHFLVSALRGAADTNGDGRVTLSEAHAYTTAQTLSATTARARTIQHPSFRFDIAGHGEVVLTDLRESAASLRLDPDVHGQVVVTEKGSPFIVAEAEKPPGRAMQLALPAGRYQVHVRRETLVYLADASLPWGGQVALAARDFQPLSYQSVALKGEELEIHRRALAGGVGLSSLPMAGGPLAPSLRLHLGWRLGSWELGPRLAAWRARLRAVDTAVTTTALGGGLELAFERAFSRVDLRAYLFGEAQRWWQRVDRQGLRRSVVAALGAGAGVRLPLFARTFAQLSLEGGPSLQPGTSRLRAQVSTDLGLGLLF